MIVNRNVPIFIQLVVVVVAPPIHEYEAVASHADPPTTTTTMLPMMLSTRRGSHRGIALKLHSQTLEWLLFRHVCSMRSTIRWFPFRHINEPSGHIGRLNTHATSSHLLFGELFPFDAEFLIPAQRNHADDMLRRSVEGKRCQNCNRSNSSLCERLRCGA